MEGRCWLGNRQKRDRLTGHFIGLYAEGGIYDFQLRGDGYQGKYYGDVYKRQTVNTAQTQTSAYVRSAQSDVEAVERTGWPAGTWGSGSCLRISTRA